MTIVFFSNFINHHQFPFSKKMYELTGGKFAFIEFQKMPDSFSRSGYPNYSQEPFVVRAWEDEETKARAKGMMLSADVVLWGALEWYDIIKNRLNKGQLTFSISERWLKKGCINLFSPRLLRFLFNYHLCGWKNKPLYKLCASAYAVDDHYLLRTFIDRCFKWGYFTKVIGNNYEVIKKESSSKEISILWCARFISWKHPELVVKLAKRLKINGQRVRIDMYGNGPMYKKIEKMCCRLGVSEIVSLKGNAPNACILQEMKEHDIFLITSDQNEGWGAVLNEAMSNRCTVVCSDAIGAAPFMIKDGENGVLFKSGQIDSLYSKINCLLSGASLRYDMAERAYQDMVTLWSPEVAAENLMKLIKDIREGKKEESVKVGPCSKAVPTRSK